MKHVSRKRLKHHSCACWLLAAVCWAGLELSQIAVNAAEAGAQAEVKSATVEGQLDGDKARLVIQADLKGLGEARERAVYGATILQALRVSREGLTSAITVKVEAIQGSLKDIVLALAGDGEVRQVSGEGLEDWSVRQAAGGARFLVLRLKKADKPVTTFSGRVTTETPLKEVPASPTALTLTTEHAALANGFVLVETAAELDTQPVKPAGLVPVELAYLPEGLRPADAKQTPEPLAFRFHGTTYSLPLKITVADPEARQVVLADFRLTGQMSDELAAFTLTGAARVKNPKGGRLELLRGAAALTEFGAHPDWRLRILDGRYVAEFDKAGEFPLKVQFNAAVRAAEGWNQVEFGVAPAALLPVVLRGLKADTQFRFAGAARPERSGEDFLSFLPPNGQVKLAWKEVKPEAEGKLFYAAEALAQVTVSPGLLRQTLLVNLKVMQGELNRLTLFLKGEGEVTRVQGPAVLSWNLEPDSGSAERKLVVQFNEPQKDVSTLQVQVQRPLGSFPQAAEAVQLRPEGATRYGGFVRVVNEGAVRLEVLQASGLSQISPEQVPQTEAAKALLPAQTTQTFAYRFSGADFQLRIQADNILPELTVSQVLAYHLGETELSIDAEIELDVREAPLRELVLRVPKGYAIARLNAPGVSDYFPTETAEGPDAQLRLVYANPISGRQLIQLRLERNKPLGEARWVLPKLEVAQAKSVRGHVGISADAGFRLSPAATQGLTELATAFFPKKLAGIQAAFRLSEPAWQATLNVERLPQSIQADVFHLFSVGEGIAYGSSLVNYLVTGAPVSTFKLGVSDEYFNVEFTGKNVRSWQKTDGAYVVQLHTPVSGTYMLLASYERPFKAQGEELTFTGARPLDAQSEQGHTVVVSTYQFQVQTVKKSPGLTPLEPGEVPPEHRLMFDAPILAAYRYTSRPFDLQLQLKPLAQGETISQVVDRAALMTRISEEGQIVTDARYFVKNKGTPHLQLTLPEDAELWSVTVNSSRVVPVRDQKSNLIPLPQHADPNTVNDVQVKLASRAKNPRRITVSAPIVAAAVLLAEWRLEPDTGRRLVYRGGTLTPVWGVRDASGFAGLARLFAGGNQTEAIGGLLAVLGLLLVAAGLWRWAAAPGHYRFGTRHLLSGALALVGCVVAAVALVQLWDLARSASQSLPRDLRFLAPVQQASASLRVEVGNLDAEPSVLSHAWALWPVALAVVAWLYSLVTSREWFRKVRAALVWTLVFWTALRLPNGAPVFFLVAVAFVALQVLWPGLRQWWQVPRRPAPASPPPAAAAAAVVLGIWLGAQQTALAQSVPIPGGAQLPPIAESVIQDVRVEDEFVFGAAKLRWQALKGQVLPVLGEPGVLTRSEHPADAVRLVQVTEGDKRSHLLVAEKTGAVEVDLRYQARVQSRENQRGFVSPIKPGVVNRLTLTLVGADVDVTAPQAVSVRREADTGTNTVASLVLAPASEPWITWKPRSRDVRREKAVFYGELFQLYVPGAGVVEGIHEAQVRPAQGEVSELAFDVPVGSTITDVIAPVVSWWRFDSDARRLRVGLSSAQSRPCSITIKSQMATGPLPFEQSVGLVSLAGAAGQVGLVGIATGSEVQLDRVEAEGFSSINLEDFPPSTLEPLRAQVAGLTLRRGFRYAEPKGSLKLKVIAVEPDVRVESQQTLSLGEDRTLLAATLDVEITRAGIFKLSFLLPTGLEVESVSGAALSHWTEVRADEGRIITLNLKGKTEGKQQFAISLAGPGVRSVQGWAAPRLVLREAAKQRGQLLVVPEQGMRLQAAVREGVTQLDPLASGIRQKGVLAFRLLQAEWQLKLDIEQVSAWVQVTSLQHVQVTEGQFKVAVNLQYEIENTGVKAFRARLPAKAENVRFRGEQVADFLRREAAAGADTNDWEIKLHRRVIGKYLLQLTYTIPLGERDAEATVIGVQAQEVNLQRGFLTLQAGGRRQVQIGAPPPSLQPTEWQVIPRTLQQDIQAASANYAFRLVEPDARLAVRLDRHEAARLLPARVSSVDLASAISDAGVVLTQVRLQLIPGDKRLLQLTLPEKAKFWFAFVNQNSVWPWNETNRVLIPLEQHSKTGQATTVEFFYTCQAGKAGASSLDLQLLGPKFDLPLENITWRVFLSEKWKLADWSGSLQLQDQQAVVQPMAADLDTYIRNEASLRQEKTRQAEQYLSLANSLLGQGDPQQARRAFQAAYGLSQHDYAFNEDARVQLHNLKLQQALVGLNVRQAKVAGEAGALAEAPRALREGLANYTQQEAKQLIDRNTAEDNAGQNRLAERIIQQQDAAVANPAAIRAVIPEQGRLFTFTRPLEVNTWADLKLGLEATAIRPATFGFKVLVLFGALALAAVLGWLVRRRPSEA